MLDYISFLKEAKKQKFIGVDKKIKTTLPLACLEVLRSACVCVEPNLRLRPLKIFSIHGLAEADSVFLRVVGVDSSTAAFDRHFGLDLGFIQTSELSWFYAKGCSQKSAFDQVSSLEFIEGSSVAELEPLAALAELTACAKADPKGQPRLAFFDGSLSFLLRDKDPDFCHKVLASLCSLDPESVLVGYTSRPASAEVCKALHADKCLPDQARHLLDALSDEELLEELLTPGQLCSLGKRVAGGISIFSYYLKAPIFEGSPSEIAKLEVCLVSRADAEARPILKKALNTVFDQLKKGNGYIRALEMAHNLAVISERDKFAIAQCLSNLQDGPEFSLKLQKKLLFSWAPGKR